MDEEKLVAYRDGEVREADGGKRTVTTKVYIAGPMQGRKMNNFQAFAQAAAYLRSIGYEVVNPAESDMAEGIDPTRSLDDQGILRETVLRRDFQSLLECDRIWKLQGWECSEGAQAESLIARLSGIKVLSL